MNSMTMCCIQRSIQGHCFVLRQEQLECGSKACFSSIILQVVGVLFVIGKLGKVFSVLTWAFVGESSNGMVQPAISDSMCLELVSM